MSQLVANFTKNLDVLYQLSLDINFSQPSLKFALASVAFNPIFWNVVARIEYYTKFLTKISGGAKNGCYLLAVTIFSLGIFRDYLFHEALKDQIISPFLDSFNFKYAGVGFFAIGNVLVLSSMFALGVTGTYLGDYFGILMKERVTGFPFNIVDNPMYVGSTLSFLGTSLYFGKAAGLFITLVVHLMYTIALYFEEPFTAKIYSSKEDSKKLE